ncbi:DNA polymerase III subunit delta' [Dissulfurispira thermophila]|uniref:DNA polymerase III subunit delta n=2 Tax=root TaxID=1 RepID=A0A7G1H0J8_9BACT|nr:DNA polymerase III subunit delta' [Dissulfurispira thermophila]BCB95663.1 DNA polymerase III subunit delta' [Dissulfurispira thermophila]
MAIRDIIGQDRALRILLGTLKRNRVPSSILMSGDSGIGKKLTAINYAKAINCYEPVDFDCCDKCPSCKKIDSSIHPDILIVTLENVEDIFSLKPKEGKDKHRYEFPIEFVRKLEEVIYLKPYEGKKKVIIIDDADALNISAANAFLKTLEEPPPDSLIILISSNPEGLPDTIRSRCVNVRFYPLSANACREVILRNKDFTDISSIFNLFMGRPGLAASKDFIKEIERFTELLNNMIYDKSKDIWFDKGEIKSWLEMALILLRDVAIYKITKSKSYLILDNRQLVTGNKQKLNDIIDLYKDIQRLRDIADFNLNKSITWNYVASTLRDFVSQTP